jgi:hypothetical protein
VLAEEGIEVPEGMEVVVDEGEEVSVEDDADRVRHFTFPASPPGDLTDEDLVGSPVAFSFSGVCGACAICARCGCRCRCW